MTKVSGIRKERTNVITDSEFQETLAKARNDTSLPEYYRIRDAAVLCIFRLTGKRVREVAQLKQNDIDVREKSLNITFNVVKKRKEQMLTTRREKEIPLSDPLTKHIIDYRTWLLENVGNQIEWFFPRTHYSPFLNTLTLDKKPLTTRQLLRIVQKHNKNIWCHLFRETVGAEIVRADPSVMAVWKVKRRLDLEKTETAFRYMDRYGKDVIEREQPQ
jgi:integrase